MQVVRGGRWRRQQQRSASLISGEQTKSGRGSLVRHLSAEPKVDQADFPGGKRASQR